MSAKLYSPWLKAEEKSSIISVNPMIEINEWQNLLKLVNGFFRKHYLDSKNYLNGESNIYEVKENEDMPKDELILRKHDSEACFQNALAMSLELEALFVTSKTQSLIKKRDLKEAILTQLRKYELNNMRLNEWALKFLK